MNELTQIKELVELKNENRLLRYELGQLAQRHHDTITNSTMHDPENIASFKNCPCITCMRVVKILS